MQEEGSPGKTREMEMGLAQMEQIKAAVDSMAMQKESLQTVVRDYDKAIEVLGALKDGSGGEIIVPIGGLVDLKVHMKEGTKPLVDRGMGILMEMEIDPAIDKVNERKSRVEGSIASIDERMKELMTRYEAISKRTQELYQGQMGSGEGPEKMF